MSVRCLTWCWSKDLGRRPGEKLLLTAIGDQAGDEGIGWSGCTPAKLKKMTELSNSSFYRHRDWLVERGLLLVVERYRRDGVKTDSWFILTIDLKAAYEQFETMVRDGAIEANPLTPEGELVPLARPTTGRISPTVGHQDRPTMGQEDPTMGQGSPTVGLVESHGGTDPSRVDGSPSFSPSSVPSLSPADGERERPNVIDVIEVCNHLADRRAERDPVRVDPRPWHDDAEQLLAEGRTVEQIVAVIDYSQDDEFNRKVVRTMAHIRGRFSDLAERGNVELRGPGAASVGACCAAVGSPPAPAEAEWSALAMAANDVVGGMRFDIWLSAAHAHAGGEDELVLAVPAGMHGEVVSRFGGLLNRLAGRELEITTCDLGRA